MAGRVATSGPSAAPGGANPTATHFPDCRLTMNHQASPATAARFGAGPYRGRMAAYSHMAQIPATTLEPSRNACTLPPEGPPSGNAARKSPPTRMRRTIESRVHTPPTISPQRNTRRHWIPIGSAGTSIPGKELHDPFLEEQAQDSEDDSSGRRGRDHEARPVLEEDGPPD